MGFINNFGNVIGDSLAATNGQKADPLGDFIAQNQAAWDQRYANYQQMVGAFSDAGAASHSNDVLLAAAPGYSGIGSDRLQVSAVPGLDADIAAARAYLNKLDGKGGVGTARGAAAARSGELSSSAMYASGYGDIRETVTPIEGSAAEAAAELAGRFVKGAVHGAADMVWQPIAQTIDLGQVAYGLFTGGASTSRIGSAPLDRTTKRVWVTARQSPARCWAPTQ